MFDKKPMIGFGLVVLSVIGFMQNWLGILGKLLFGVLLIVGMIELYHWLIFLLEFPGYLFSHVLSLPIKRRGTQILHNGMPVIAYGMRPDRVVLVRQLQHSKAIHATSVFRGPRKLAGMKELLDSANVPEHRLNEERLQEALGIWNQDAELRQTVRSVLHHRLHDQGKLPRGEPLIVLDMHSKARIDRVSVVLGFLWESQKYRGTPENIIQLAIWHALAVDVFDGRETTGTLRREFPELWS